MAEVPHLDFVEVIQAQDKVMEEAVKVVENNPDQFPDLQEALVKFAAIVRLNDEKLKKLLEREQTNDS